MIISLKRAGFGSIKIAEFRHFLLKCLYQARKVTGHVMIGLEPCAIELIRTPMVELEPLP
jgi:hypothetical protein